ncbi:hypothetical protein RQP46_007363 [Phenoliferia psychrophenolica]
MGWTRSPFALFPAAAPVPNSPAPLLKATSSASLSISHIEHATIAPPPKRIARAATGASEELLELAANGREPVGEDELPVFSAAEVSAHNSLESGIWIVIEARVYDVTSFVGIHPGGKEVFTQFAGHACTWQFWLWHSKKHLEEWSSSLLIGRVDQPPPNPYPERKRWIKTS